MNKPAQPHAPTATAAAMLAMCSLAFLPGDEAPTRIKLLPAGSFAAHDGRPGNLTDAHCAAWVLADANAAALVQAAAGQQREFVIDYEHQTLQASANGQPAPAAGWFKALEYVPGDGLYAVGVRWTDKAAAMLRAGEYKYLSPVFSFNKHTGMVTGLHSVALTNNPGLDMLPALAQLTAALAALAGDTIFQPPPQTEIIHMEKTAVLVALGLPATTTDEAALTALAALRAENDKLKAGQFDPARHIPLDEHKKVSDQLAALTADAEKAQHESLMTAALADARILPANEAYWRGQPLAALQAFLKDAKPLANLATMQTGGKPPAGDGTGTAALTAEERYACKQMGLSHEDYLKAKQALDTDRKALAAQA